MGIRYSLAATKPARPATLTLDGGSRRDAALRAQQRLAENVGAEIDDGPTARGRQRDHPDRAGRRAPTSTICACTKRGADAVRPGLCRDRRLAASSSSRPPTTAPARGSSRWSSTSRSPTTGLYVLDVAANAGAPNGQGLTYFVNGVQVGADHLPRRRRLAASAACIVELTAGVEYQVRVVSDAPGRQRDRLSRRAAGADQPERRHHDPEPRPGLLQRPAALQLAGQSERRRHRRLADATSRRTRSVRITNSGTEPLQFLEAKLTGPFVLANPAVFEVSSLAPGQSIDVEVLFNRAAYTRDRQRGHAASSTAS